MADLLAGGQVEEFGFGGVECPLEAGWGCVAGVDLVAAALDDGDDVGGFGREGEVRRLGGRGGLKQRGEGEGGEWEHEVGLFSKRAALRIDGVGRFEGDGVLLVLED